MNDRDFSVEAEDEFFEDFSGWEITDDQLSELLIVARATDDTMLRRVVKQNQYYRWLLNNLIDLSDRGDHVSGVIELARFALNKRKTNHDHGNEHNSSDELSG